MKISKQDALTWFRFFAELPEDEDLLPHQQEIAWAVFSQIEEAVDDRFRRLKAQIRGLKTIGWRTFFVGDERRVSAGCRSCLTGTGLSAVRKTNKCNLQCKFCYDYGVMDQLPPVGEGMRPKKRKGRGPCRWSIIAANAARKRPWAKAAPTAGEGSPKPGSSCPSASSETP